MSRSDNLADHHPRGEECSLWYEIYPRKSPKLADEAVGQSSFPNMLGNYGLLEPDILFPHENGLNADEAKLLKKHDILISSTPDTECQMACGEIGCFRDDMQASLV